MKTRRRSERPRRRANVKVDQTAERKQLFFSLMAAAANQSVFIILCRSNVKYIYIEHEQRQSDTIRTKGGDRMTREQRQKLHSLAYWIAEAAYTRERHPEDTDTLNRAEKTIKALFDELDKLQVPFTIQNQVIEFSRNWRRYKTERLIF